jgi:hypothetical protein
LDPQRTAEQKVSMFEFFSPKLVHVVPDDEG